MEYLLNTIGDITSAVVFLLIILGLILANRYGILGYFKMNGNKIANIAKI